MQAQHIHQLITRDCHFCSLVSKANEEDPIGTADTCKHWLIMEVPQPWPQEIFQVNPIIKSVIGLFQELIFQHGIQLKPMLITPNREYSHPGFACDRFGTPIYRQLRKEYALAAKGKLKVWQITHFGGHQFAPTLFDLPDGSTAGAYEAIIEVCGEVMSALNSAKEMELKAVKQYRVSRLVKLE